MSLQPAHRPLPVSLLTTEAFRPFGQVIELGTGELAHPDQARLFAGTAHLDFAGGRANLDTLYAAPRPPRVESLERHTNSSQAFIPLAPVRMLVAVALPGPDDEPVAAERVRAFITDGRQGVNFAPRIWHHPVIPIGAPLMLAVIHRGTSGDMQNEVAKLGAGVVLDLVVAP